MSKRRQWQAEATMPNGAKVIFGVGARSQPAALLRAYQTLAEFPCVADQLTLRRVHWRGMRFAARQAQLAGERDAARPSDGGAPSAPLPPSRA